MPRTCPRSSQRAIISYSCPLTDLDVGRWSSVDHASGGVGCVMASLTNIVKPEGVLLQLLPNLHDYNLEVILIFIFNITKGPFPLGLSNTQKCLLWVDSEYLHPQWVFPLYLWGLHESRLHANKLTQLTLIIYPFLRYI